MIAPRIAQLIRLLSSSAEGEVLAAVDGISKKLKSDGRDRHVLAEACERGWQGAAFAAGSLQEWQIIARNCIVTNRGILSTAEVNFLQNMAARRTEPTERQWRWIDAIAGALGVRCAA